MERKGCNVFGNMAKFHFYRQRDTMLCGVACLQMICRHWGGAHLAEAAPRLCPVTAEGVSLLGIVRAARALGLKAVCGKVSSGQLSNSFMPCILHWNQNHFVVLYRVRDGKTFYVADLGKGRMAYGKDEFERHWGNTRQGGMGIAVFFEPMPGFHHMVAHHVERTRPFRLLWGYVMEYRRYFSQILLGLILCCILQLMLPFLTQGIVDLGIRNKDLGLVWMILLGEFVIVAGRTATDLVRRWLLLHISMRTNISLVSDFFIRLLDLPMPFFDTKMTGDMLQRMSDHTRVQTFLTVQVPGVMFAILSFVVLGGVLLLYDRLVFGVFLSGSAIYGLWIAYFLGRRKVLDYEMFEQQAISQDKTYQFVTSMQEIKLQGCENRRRWEWEDTQADLFNVRMKSLKLRQTQEVGSVFINEMKNILITVLAAAAVINGQMTLGAMLAIQYIVGQLNSPVEQLMSLIYSLQDVRISLDRIDEIHQSEKETSGGDTLADFRGRRDITVGHVEFKYDPHALRKTLDDVSLRVREGEVTAIVGASGSGKTTLVKLMLGYYKPLGGAILVSGTDIGRYDMRWWRKHCGVVMQEGVIFSESIARNIAVGDGVIDTGMLEKSARIANIHDYVMSLPSGYDTKVGRDGTGLSQGQKQRVLIARAVYKNPDFLFLDEATNALDARNERIIVENLRVFCAGKTVVVVAHRLSTVKSADQIIVLGDGKVLETGNHQTLTAARGAYYNLVRNHLELGN